MAISILHQPRADKHQRLFELIRQEALAKAAAARDTVPVADGPADMQRLRRKAEASMQP